MLHPSRRRHGHATTLVSRSEVTLSDAEFMQPPKPLPVFLKAVRVRASLVSWMRGDHSYQGVASRVSDVERVPSGLMAMCGDTGWT